MISPSIRPIMFFSIRTAWNSLPRWSAHRSITIHLVRVDLDSSATSKWLKKSCQPGNSVRISASNALHLDIRHHKLSINVRARIKDTGYGEITLVRIRPSGVYWLALSPLDELCRPSIPLGFASGDQGTARYCPAFSEDTTRNEVSWSGSSESWVGCQLKRPADSWAGWITASLRTIGSTWPLSEICLAKLSLFRVARLTTLLINHCLRKNARREFGL